MRQLKIRESNTPHSQVIDSYLKEIAKYKVFTAEEEAEMALKAKLGDEEAFEKMIKHNLKFVVSVAKQYQFQGLSLPDLINEGNIGLIKAIKKFDETRGFKFISYAVWWIRQQISQALNDTSRLIRLPANKNLDSLRANRAEQKLIATIGREVSYEEISKECEVSKETIEVVNVKESVPEDLDYFGKEDPEEISSIEKDIQRVLSTITEREGFIIDRYYGLTIRESMTLEDIGEELGLTRERVRQIKEKAVKKLKHQKRNILLKKYLG